MSNACAGQPGAGGMGPLSDIPELEDMGRRGSEVGYLGSSLLVCTSTV